MASLASHVNVWETCLQLLRRRGYRLELLLSDEEDDAPDGWSAEKDGFSFQAENPVALLGLAAVYEDVRPAADEPYWWSAKTSREDPRLHDSLLDEALAARDARLTDLATLRQRDPRAWEAKLRAAFALSGDEATAAGHLGIPRKDLRKLLADPRLADLRG